MQVIFRNNLARSHSEVSGLVCFEECLIINLVNLLVHILGWEALNIYEPVDKPIAVDICFEPLSARDTANYNRDIDIKFLINYMLIILMELKLIIGY